jgi:arsenite methyltransferase
MESVMSDDIKGLVRQKYGEAALRVMEGSSTGCCGPACGCGEDAKDPITSDLYDAVTTTALPEAAVLASLGCGNPTALAELHAGEVVLDLGSGGGIDVLLSAQRVGPTGKAYGLDMTDEMLELARRNAAAADAAGGASTRGAVEFLKGEMESIPLPDDSVDVIISNCVVNLSSDKRQVLREAYRVLKPGGRLAIADVVVRGEVPADVRRNMELWVGCLAGALEEREFESLLREVGFEEASLEPTRIYGVDDARAFLEEAGLDVTAFTAAVEGRFMAAFVRGRKPTLPSIRAAGPGDVAAVEELLAAAELPLAGVRDWAERFVVAESGGRLVGVAGLEAHGRDGILRSVAVDPSARGSGLGSRLTARIIAAARQSGLRRLYLLTTTAEGYFPRHGFRPIPRDTAPPAVQRSVEFSEACPASAVAMVLELEGAAVDA